LVLVFYAFVQVYGSSVFICNGGKVEKDNGWVTSATGESPPDNMPDSTQPSDTTMVSSSV